MHTRKRRCPPGVPVAKNGPGDAAGEEWQCSNMLCGISANEWLPQDDNRIDNGGAREGVSDQMATRESTAPGRRWHHQALLFVTCLILAVTGVYGGPSGGAGDPEGFQKNSK